MFGTRDRENYEENGKTVIIDYKTGKIPKNAMLVNSSGLYAKKMPRYKVMEGNYYIFLWLLEHGYTYVADGLDARGKDKWFCHKDGKKVNINFLDYAFVFTNIKKAVVMRGKASMVSIRSIINNLEKVRNPNQSYDKEPSIMRCKHCQFYLTDCKGELDIEIFGDIL